MRSVKKGFAHILWYRILLIFIFCCTITVVCRADGDDDPGNDPDAIPLDGGVVTLVAAGVGYGIKKMRDTKQQKRKQNDLSSATSYEDVVK